MSAFFGGQCRIHLCVGITFQNKNRYLNLLYFVLFEILLKYGLDLTLPIEEKLIEGKKVFNIGVGALFICLSDGITSKVAEGIGAWKIELEPEACRVIFKDSGFTDVEKTNSVQILKRFGITEVKSI
jgi:adenine-specific DNA-methyltransferase